MGKSSSKNPSVTHRAENPRAIMARNGVQNDHDPYLPDGHYPDDTVCSGCGAVYHNQHWILDESRRDLLLSTGAAKEVVCPACRKTRDHYPLGIVSLHGNYWPEHRDDIVNLIHNEEKRGMATNPLERIMELREEDGKLIVETTNEKLAQRIGRQLHKAHKGEVEYKWSDGDRLVRVEWERSLQPH